MKAFHHMIRFVTKLIGLRVQKYIYRLTASLIFISLIIANLFAWIPKAAAQSSDILWRNIENISQSPDNTSTDPFLLSDPTGKVHLFWAEKVSTLEGNQPDTLMYTVWDGRNWFKPRDIFFAPESDGTPVIAYPHAALDQTGRIHLIWLAQPNFPNYTLFYSSSFAPNAMQTDSWAQKIPLATDLSGTQYSIDIAVRENNEVHVVYARVQQGAGAEEERAISYIRSLDGGKTWSESLDLYTIKDIQNGTSDTRILLDTDNRIYATWTEWDESGRGQSINFIRSLDNGDTWQQPVVLSRTIGNEYERDWSNIEILGQDQLVVMWEGGWRAYRQAQYSDDAGATWSEAIDTFPWLIGENGTVEFARDSNDQLHLFLAQRVREGYEEWGDGTNASVWHSTWEGGQKWSEPRIVTPAFNLINPKATITGGNQVVIAWYTQRDLEIMVITGEIQGAPSQIQDGWPDPETAVSSTLETVSSPIAETAVSGETPEPTPLNLEDSGDISGGLSTGATILVGVLPVMFLIGAFYLIIKRNH
jgi:hypothetical protein